MGLTLSLISFLRFMPHGAGSLASGEGDEGSQDVVVFVALVRGCWKL
jgi:hypothetical protein